MVDRETREALIEQQPHRAWGMARHCRQPKPPRRPALAEYLRPLALGIRASVRHGQDRRRVLQALGGRQDGGPVCRAVPERRSSRVQRWTKFLQLWRARPCHGKTLLGLVEQETIEFVLPSATST